MLYQQNNFVNINNKMNLMKTNYFQLSFRAPYINIITKLIKIINQLLKTNLKKVFYKTKLEKNMS